MASFAIGNGHCRSSWLIAVVSLLFAFTCALEAAAGGLEVTQQESDCHGKFGKVSIRASKEEADKIRVQKPDSFVSELVLGKIEYNNGQFPKALMHFRKARAGMELSPGFKSKPGDIPWHAITLNSMILSLDAMDRISQELAVIDDYLKNGYDKLESANPDLRAVEPLKIWALIKSGKKNKALDLAQKKLKQRGLTPEEKIDAETIYANTVFANFPDGKKAFELYCEVIKDGRAIGPEGNLPYGNAAFHFMRNGKYGEAEDLLMESSKFPVANSESFPCLTLAEMYTSSCEWGKSFAAYKQSWNWILMKHAYIRQELDKDLKLSVAQYYLAAGYPDRALLFSTPLLSNSIRAGFTSRSADFWKAGAVLTSLSALRQTEIIRRDVSALEGWKGFWKNIWDSSCNFLITRENLEEELRGLIISQSEASDKPRDFLAFANCPTWLWPEMAMHLSPRITEKIIRDYPLQGAQSQFFDRAFTAEILFAKGEQENIIKTVESALESLPAEERIMRARMLAIRGASLARDGMTDKALESLSEAYQIDPAVFRLLGIKLPLTLKTDSSPEASHIRRLLEKSSEIALKDMGISASVKTEGQGIASISISDHDGNLIRSYKIKLIDNGTPRKDGSIFTETVNGIFTSFIHSPSDFDALEGRAVDFNQKKGK